jgi:hypothetical protein
VNTALDFSNFFREPFRASSVFGDTKIVFSRPVLFFPRNDPARLTKTGYGTISGLVLCPKSQYYSEVRRANYFSIL